MGEFATLCTSTSQPALPLHEATRTMRSEQDSAWKDILDAYFKEFLEFFFPEIHRDIDWSKPVEFLDKEFQKIVRKSEIGKQLADKLAKVFLLDGSDAWLLIHVEVQGYSEEKFEQRIYIYNYRIFDRYAHDVISLAVLTDKNEKFRPEAYEVKRWRFHHLLRFPVIKLLDYLSRWEELERDPNPFAVVVMAHLKAHESHTDGERLDAKRLLVRMLYERGCVRQDILELFRFIDWLLVLPEELEVEIEHEITTLEKEKTMPYVTSI